MKETRENVETFATEVIYERTNTVSARFLRVLLGGLSKVWEGVVSLRHFFYRKQIATVHHLGCRVISIGNLTVGGTGKTPVVELFARALQDGGRKVAILSRGYKSEKPPGKRRIKDLWKEKEEEPPRVVSDGKKVLLTSRLAGDEPYMLANNLKDVVVLVDKDRVKAGRWAIEEYGVDTILLDDGFQHIRLKHDLDVVLIDQTAPFGTEHMLPRGTLREPARYLRRAHYIFLTKCEPGVSNEELKARIRQYNPTAEVIETAHRPQYLEQAFGKERMPLTELQGLEVGAICGIASPASFYSALEKLGAKIRLRKSFTDHHRYGEQEIRSFVNICSEQDINFIVTTEKDAVRMPNPKPIDVPVYFLRMEIGILTDSGKEVWRSCVEQLSDETPADAISHRHGMF